MYLYANDNEYGIQITFVVEYLSNKNIPANRVYSLSILNLFLRKFHNAGGQGKVT